MLNRKLIGYLLSVSTALLLLCPVVVADVSEVIFTIEASNEAGAGILEITADQLTYIPASDMYIWTQLTPIPITDSFTQIAVLKSANVALRTDPQVGMGFAVQAGASDTTFTIKSALLSFPTISGAVAEGRASAGFTATDVTGDGVELTGLGAPGTGAYRADYNGFVPSGTQFTNLVASVIAGPGGTGSGSQTHPPFGYVDIPGDVWDMSAQVSFTLTANDLASGTSTFEIIPEPATAALLLLVPAALLLRRRS